MDTEGEGSDQAKKGVLVSLWDSRGWQVPTSQTECRSVSGWPKNSGVVGVQQDHGTRLLVGLKGILVKLQTIQCSTHTICSASGMVLISTEVRRSLPMSPRIFWTWRRCITVSIRISCVSCFGSMVFLACCYGPFGPCTTAARACIIRSRSDSFLLRNRWQVSDLVA